jgi:hypothetical protein
MTLRTRGVLAIGSAEAIKSLAQCVTHELGEPFLARCCRVPDTAGKCGG